MRGLVEMALDTLASVRAHGLRYALTSLGIVWGIFTMTYLQASTDGFDLYYQKAMVKVGSQLVVLFPGVVPRERIGDRSGRPVELELADLERLERSALIESTTPNLLVGPRVMRAERRTKLVTVAGVSHKAEQIRNFTAAVGRFIGPEDVRSARRVVFLGHLAAERLFGTRSPLGRTVHIDSIAFEVIGVARPKGRQLVSFGPSDDEQALIPVTAAQRWFKLDETLTDVFVRARSPEESHESLAIARLLLGLHHGFDPEAETALGSFNMEEALDLVRLLGLGISIFFGATGAVTLAVGGVGVMNIMLVVVGERRKEIGLRKAVGATSGAIFLEFLAESVAVTAAAGAVGALLGSLAVLWTTAQIPVDPLTGVSVTSTPQLRAGTVALTSLVLMATGVAAGAFPALRAMQVEPAVALREL